MSTTLPLTLVRLRLQRLRRDRWQLAAWVLGTAVLAMAAISAVSSAYGTEGSRKEILGVAIATRTILVFRGMPDGVSDGQFVFFLLFAWLALMAGLMSTFLAVRHTRADEEIGRAELIAATPAGRMLPTLATVIHGVAANVVLGLFVAIGWVAVGLPAAGSFVAGAALTVSGITFLAVGLVAAQLFRTSRAANSLGVAAVIGAYLLRGIGDAAGTPAADLLHLTPAWPSYLSPIGYGQATRPFSDANLWPLVVPLGGATVLIALVFWLQSVRDQGASLVPARNGRGSAPRTLRSSFGLAWRLNRSILVSWTIGGMATGLLATSLSGLVDQIAGTSPQILDLLRSSLGEAASIEQAFVAVFYGLIGILAACCAVQVGIRARQEETSGTAEAVLATATGRVRWLFEYWVVGVIVIVVVLAASLGAGLLGTQDAAIRRNVIEAATAQLPACLVFLGITVLVFAFLPRLTIAIGWSAVGVSAILGLFGPLFQFPEWMVQLSPFAHSPVPGAGADWAGGWVMLGIGLAAAALAIASMRRRELVPAG